MPQKSFKTRAATGALVFAGAATWRRRSRGRTPPQTPDSVPADDVLVAREESAAAAQAGAIGGQVAPLSHDPAQEPLYQAGEGEQDGWETAEAELVENATHGDGAGNPAGDAFPPELESDRSSAVYGEADQEEPTDS